MWLSQLGFHQIIKGVQVKEVRHKVGRKKFRDGWLPNVEEFKHLRVVFTSEKGAGD